MLQVACGIPYSTVVSTRRRSGRYLREHTTLMLFNHGVPTVFTLLVDILRATAVDDITPHRTPLPMTYSAAQSLHTLVPFHVLDRTATDDHFDAASITFKTI